MMKTFLKFCMWLLVLAGLAGAAYCYWSKKDLKKGAPVSAVTAPIVVNVTTVQQRAWNRELRVVGTVAVNGQATIAAEVAGRITQIAVNSGDHVQQGQLIFRINDADAKAALKQAQANLANSRKAYRRHQLMLPKGAVSRASFDDAKQQYKSDQADVAQKKAQLALTAIRAPYAGVIGLQRVNVGDYVSAGDALVGFQPDQKSRVDFSIPSQYVHDLQRGMTVTFFTEVHPEVLREAKVSAIDSLVDVDTRNIGVEAEVASAGPPLAPGAFVEVVLHVGPKKSVIVVPETALRYALGGVSVFKVEHDRVHEVPVKLVERRAAGAVIQGKIRAGDTVVTRGVMKLRDGVEVNTQ